MNLILKFNYSFLFQKVNNIFSKKSFIYFLFFYSIEQLENFLFLLISYLFKIILTFFSMIIYFTHLINYFESIYTKENFLQIVKLFTKSYLRIIRIRSIKQVVNNHIPIIIDSLRNSK